MTSPKADSNRRLRSTGVALIVSTGAVLMMISLASCSTSTPAPESSQESPTDLAQLLNCQVDPSAKKATQAGSPVATYVCRPDPSAPKSEIFVNAYASKSDREEALDEACKIAEMGVEAGLSADFFVQDAYVTNTPFDGYEYALVEFGGRDNPSDFVVAASVGKSDSLATKVGC